MLDLKYVLSHPDEVRANCRDRHVNVDVDRLLALGEQRSQLIQQRDTLRAEQNAAAKAIGKADPAERPAMIAESNRLKAAIAEADTAAAKVEEELFALVRQIPNLTHPDSPRGGEDASREVRRWGTPRSFDFAPQDHVALGEALDLIDFAGGAKVAGRNFYFLKNDAVLLELALIRFAIDRLVARGYTPATTPDLAKLEVLDGVGFNPRGAESQIYTVEGTDLGLIATAEITLGGLLQDEILPAERLPLKFVGVSHCFRRESGAHGKASRGLYRVHQFTKVEMFAFTRPEDSAATHDEMLAVEEELNQALGLPYRVLDIATGDLGGPAYRKYDVEVWMPGRGDGGEYGEVTSTSNCTDYQSRRLGIRFRRDAKARPELVHTLNGTAIAISRTLLAILETYQQADGSVVVPEVLRAWMGKDRIEKRG